MADRLVGLFDIGATHTRLALATGSGGFGAPVIIDTDHSAKGYQRLLHEFKNRTAGRNFSGLVGGIAGQIDQATGKLFHATNLPRWNGLALAGLLGEEFEAPVLIYNDASMAGLGEVTYGAGRRGHIVMYETVSTGVNAALIIDGSIQPSVRGFEIGEQLVVGRNGRPTTLEAATGGAALERRTGHHAHELATSSLWRSEARLLAHGLYNSLLHWSPDTVVFGGSMMRDIQLAQIDAELRKLPTQWPEYPALKLAELGDAGGLYGALALARQHQLI